MQHLFWSPKIIFYLMLSSHEWHNFIHFSTFQKMKISPLVMIATTHEKEFKIGKEVRKNRKGGKGDKKVDRCEWGVYSLACPPLGTACVLRQALPNPPLSFGRGSEHSRLFPLGLETLTSNSPLPSPASLTVTLLEQGGHPPSTKSTSSWIHCARDQPLSSTCQTHRHM